MARGRRIAREPYGARRAKVAARRACRQALLRSVSARTFARPALGPPAVRADRVLANTGPEDDHRSAEAMAARPGLRDRDVFWNPTILTAVASVRSSGHRAIGPRRGAHRSGSRSSGPRRSCHG